MAINIYVCHVAELWILIIATVISLENKLDQQLLFSKHHEVKLCCFTEISYWPITLELVSYGKFSFSNPDLDGDRNKPA